MLLPPIPTPRYLRLGNSTLKFCTYFTTSEAIHKKYHMGMGKRRMQGGQEVDAEERTFNCSTLIDHPLVSHGKQCIQSKESQGCECDMVSLMKDEHLL